MKEHRVNTKKFPSILVETTPINKSIYAIAIIFVMVFFSAQCVQIGSTARKENDFGSTWLNAESYGYLVHACFACVVPLLINKLGYRICFVIGASGYFMQCIAPLIYQAMGGGEKTWILNIVLAYKGLVSPVIWTSYGSFKTLITDKTNTGATDAAFYTIYKGCAFVTTGMLNLTDFLGFNYDNKVWMFSGFSALAMISMIAFGMLDKTPVKTEDKESKTALESIKGALGCFTEGKSFRLLFIAFAVPGIMRSWIQGDYMKYGGTNASLFMFPFSIASMAGSLLFGKLFDKVENKKVLLYSGCFFGLASIGTAVWATKLRDQGNLTLDLYVSFLTMALAAAGISGVEVALSASYGILCPEKSTYMFSAHQIVYGFGMFISKKLGGIKPADLPDWAKIGRVEHKTERPSDLPLSLVGIVVATACLSIAVLCIYLSDPLVANPKNDVERHNTFVEHRSKSLDVSSFTA